MTRRTCLLTGLLLILAFHQTAMATVTGTLSGGLPPAGMPMILRLDLTADTPVAAINGQLDYGSAWFSNPTIQTGSGAEGFLALGNEVAPGQYRFVVYANPTSLFAMGQAAVYFQLDTISPYPATGTTQIQFSLEAASDGVGVSLADVDFGGLTLSFDGKNAIGDWALYE